MNSFVTFEQKLKPTSCASTKEGLQHHKQVRLQSLILNILNFLQESEKKEKPS